MAYPEPIPALKGRHAKEFLERLREFKLSRGQKKFLAGAKKYFQKLKPSE